MRPVWKPHPHAGFTWAPRVTTRVWATQVALHVVASAGRAWAAQRTRQYYLRARLASFVRSRPVGRPIRAKFRQTTKRKRPARR